MTEQQLIPDDAKADVCRASELIFEALQQEQINPFHAIYAFLSAAITINRTQREHIPEQFQKFTEEELLHGLLDAAIVNCDRVAAGGEQ